jgi:hypothetical protein
MPMGVAGPSVAPGNGVSTQETRIVGAPGRILARRLSSSEGPHGHLVGCVGQHGGTPAATPELAGSPDCAGGRGCAHQPTMDAASLVGGRPSTPSSGPRSRSARLPLRRAGRWTATAAQPVAVSLPPVLERAGSLAGGAPRGAPPARETAPADETGRSRCAAPPSMSPSDASRPSRLSSLIATRTVARFCGL